MGIGDTEANEGGDYGSAKVTGGRDGKKGN